MLPRGDFHLNNMCETQWGTLGQVRGQVYEGLLSRTAGYIIYIIDGDSSSVGRSGMSRSIRGSLSIRSIIDFFDDSQDGIVQCHFGSRS